MVVENKSEPPEQKEILLLVLSRGTIRSHFYMHIIENKMPTTKEQRREKEETTTIRASDQTKEIIRRTTTKDEERTDTPSYTQMVDEYQDQTFQQRRF